MALEIKEYVGAGNIKQVGKQKPQTSKKTASTGKKSVANSKKSK